MNQKVSGLPSETGGGQEALPTRSLPVVPTVSEVLTSKLEAIDVDVEGEYEWDCCANHVYDCSCCNGGGDKTKGCWTRR